MVFHNGTDDIILYAIGFFFTMLHCPVCLGIGIFNIFRLVSSTVSFSIKCQLRLQVCEIKTNYPWGWRVALQLRNFCSALAEMSLVPSILGS